MTLAARFGGRSIALGAVTAFIILNLLAVTVAASVAAVVPEFWMKLAAALLFAIFGLQALFAKEEDEQQTNNNLKYTNIFLSAFMLIFIAELGDKTQLAVAGLATTNSAWSVWLGATLALLSTTLLAVILGKMLLKKFNSQWLHKAGGILFLAFALITSWQAFTI